MIKIINPGLLSTIQDLGRNCYQKYGIITSGVMDPIAHRLANTLIGNDENLSTLEITLLGPTMKFMEDTLISICGANLNPTINGHSVHLWRPILVKKGSQLIFNRSQAGCRAYLAVAGGFAVPEIMNSKSTYLRAEIGGFHGRKLRKGDQLRFLLPNELSKKIIYSLETRIKNKAFAEMGWSVASGLIPIYKRNLSIRVVEGRQFDLFSKGSQELFFSEQYLITYDSDRMGYRLQGAPLVLKKPFEMISEPVNFGTIQVPHDGNPILLLADRQTIGGYPKIGQIAFVDLPAIAQAKPGDFISFKNISHREAQLLYLTREKAIKMLKLGIIQKFR